jgi:excisionase family DNA binding protein
MIMEKTVFISMPINELQTLIIDSVNVCLKNSPQNGVLIHSQKSKNILDTDQLMVKLGVTRPTLSKWRKDGRIPFIQVGAVVRYDLDAVLEALSKKKGGKKC